MLKKNAANISMFFPNSISSRLSKSEASDSGSRLTLSMIPLTRDPRRIKKASNRAPGIRVDSIRQSIYGYFHRVSVYHKRIMGGGERTYTSRFQVSQ